MLFRRWWRSANFAIEGILHAAKTQRHLRYHYFSAAAVLLLSYILGVSRMEFLILSLSVIAVLLAEMFNTAIETLVDMVSPEQSEKARVAKDISAGAVLVTACGVAIIGYIILFPYLREAFDTGISITKHSKEEIALIAFIIVLILVIITKAYFGKGLPLRGGMPSGHAALAFSAWVATTYITENFVASLLSFAFAVIIAQSRVGAKAHTIWEVVLGGLMGASVTFLLFMIFS
ncbi:MAG TPA: diacylglycerol kinase [Thermodesulfovibrionales bacterium]|jgi:diacylglycerol kinase (ATP)|nr:diacylglycerol kinase [Thermodesulfovibrionales bacterium]